MRATATLALAAAALTLVACKDNRQKELLDPPAAYDPVKTEGLTLNKSGLDALTLLEGEEREAHIETLMAEGTFKGQAMCKSGAGTGELEHSKWGGYVLTCEAGTILFDIELRYNLFTSREVGKPLSANAYVEFGGTLVEFEYQDESKPRSILAKVQVGDDLHRIER